VQGLDGLVCQSGQGVGEIETRVDAKPAARFDDREDGGDLWAGILMSEMDPVFSSQGDCAHGVSKGDDMAVSKDTCRFPSSTNPLFLELFSTSKGSTDGEREWCGAVQRFESDDHPLRFPIYEYVYLLNLRAQEVIDLLEKIGGLCEIAQDRVAYHQALMQQLRAEASSSAMEHMADIEPMEEWLFERLHKTEERRLLDPDDVYIDVRIREQQRITEGHPPRIQFLDHETGSSGFDDPRDEPDEPDEAGRGYVGWRTQEHFLKDYRR